MPSVVGASLFSAIGGGTQVAWRFTVRLPLDGHGLSLAAWVFAGVLVACDPSVPLGAGGDGGTDGSPVIPACPEEQTQWGGACSVYGQRCVYLEARQCAVTYACEKIEWCDEDTTSSAGSECHEDGRWEFFDAVCEQEAVACEVAVDGDVCENAGDGCYPGCNDNRCDDHTWKVELDLDCCFWTYHHPCPSSLPIEGTKCDACENHEACTYTEERDCGPIEVQAGCAGDAWAIQDSSQCP